MSDTVRDKSIELQVNLQEKDLRLAHFQGSRLELLHIGVPVDTLEAIQDSRRGAL